MRRELLFHALILASSCDAGSDGLSLGVGEELIRTPAVPIAVLVHDPRRFEDQTLRVVGEVRRGGREHFFLRGEGWLWAPRIRVVSREPIRGDLRSGDRVEVRGVVRIAPGEQPIVIATSIERLSP